MLVLLFQVVHLLLMLVLLCVVEAAALLDAFRAEETCGPAALVTSSGKAQRACCPVQVLV